MDAGLPSPTMPQILNPDEADRLFRRIAEYDSARQRLLDEADQALDNRMHCVWLLRAGKVPMQRIERETGHSRQLLTKLLADFDPDTGKRIKALAESA